METSVKINIQGLFLRLFLSGNIKQSCSGSGRISLPSNVCSFNVSSLLIENMWGVYLQKGEILEKPGLSSVDAHGAMENFGMYVSADIATSFTVLVGIFFPSATGMITP